MKKETKSILKIAATAGATLALALGIPAITISSAAQRENLYKMLEERERAEQTLRENVNDAFNSLKGDIHSELDGLTDKENLPTAVKSDNEILWTAEKATLDLLTTTQTYQEMHKKALETAETMNKEGAFESETVFQQQLASVDTYGFAKFVLDDNLQKIEQGQKPKEETVQYLCGAYQNFQKACQDVGVEWDLDAEVHPDKYLELTIDGCNGQGSGKSYMGNITTIYQSALDVFMKTYAFKSMFNSQVSTAKEYLETGKYTPSEYSQIIQSACSYRFPATIIEACANASGTVNEEFAQDYEVAKSINACKKDLANFHAKTCGIEEGKEEEALNPYLAMYVYGRTFDSRVDDLLVEQYRKEMEEKVSEASDRLEGKVDESINNLPNAAPSDAEAMKKPNQTQAVFDALSSAFALCSISTVGAYMLNDQIHELRDEIDKQKFEAKSKSREDEGRGGK